MMFAPRNLGPTVEITAFVLTALSTIVVAARLYCRIWVAGKLQSYDYIMVAALICTWGICVDNHYQMYISGVHLKDRPANFDRKKLLPPGAKAWYTYQILYLLDICLIKLSILFFYRSIATQKKFRTIVDISIVVVGVFTLAMILANAFECPKDLRKPFTSDIFKPNNGCFDLHPLYYAQAAFNLFSDVWILCLPMPVLASLHMAKQKRIALIGVFSVGVIACVASMIRIYALHIWTAGDDSAYTGAYVVFWSNVEINSGIITASFPSLQPLFKRMLGDKSFAGSRAPYTSGGNGTSKGIGKNYLSRHSRPIPLGDVGAPASYRKGSIASSDNEMLFKQGTHTVIEGGNRNSPDWKAERSVEGWNDSKHIVKDVQITTSTKDERHDPTTRSHFGY